MKIAAEYAHRGAVVRDPAAAVGDAMGSRKRSGTNDVGYRIWQGNYGNGLLTQLQPWETSVGWWGVGPADQPYGRYSRAFDFATGRTEMAFVIDKRLWGGLPLSMFVSLTLSVTYFDEKGAFDIFVDTKTTDMTQGCKSPMHSIIGSNSKRWITTRILINNGHFGRQCYSTMGLGADILLRSTSQKNTIFHSLQIYDQSKFP